MKLVLLFDLIWQKTVENAQDLKLLMFDGWVWTVLHLVVFLVLATLTAQFIPVDAYREDRRKKVMSYFGYGLAGISSLFSYFYFYVQSHIMQIGLKSRFVFQGVIFYVILWIVLYALIVGVIYPLAFKNINFGSFRKDKN